jgi:putative nucleotidyltransferase with HDIG domain
VAGSGEIERIRNVGIRQLYIDTERGLDVAQTSKAPEVRQAPERELASAAGDGPPVASQVDLAQERGRAQRIQREAKRVVSGLMEDARLGRQIELEHVNPVVGQMVDSIFRNHDALVGLTRIRRLDRYTFEHSVSVSVLMVAFARALGLDRELIQDIGVGALLHDIGKTLVPGHILNKPGRLDPAEMAVMRDHVVHSHEILSRLAGFPEAALAVVTEHHERSDGSGYPYGKGGKQISLFGRMASVVDVYDAITSDRVYHKGMAPHLALRKLLEWSSHQFEPGLVQRFIQCVGIYPVGSVVRLESGRLGVVTESSRGDLLRPVVRVLLDARGRRWLTPRDLDLSAPGEGAGERILGAELPERWRIDPKAHLEAGA